MFKVFKIVIVFFVSFMMFVSYEVNAADAYFVWEKTQIDVPLNASLESYKDKYELSFYVNGSKSKDYYVEKEVNCSTFSTVLTNKIGKYTVYYKAISQKYYTYSTQAIIFNVVDKTPPTIKINSRIIEINVGNTIDILDYIDISDDSCAINELNVIFDDSFVLYNMVGTYDSIITVKDKYNNTSQESITIKVIDKVKPELLVQKPLILQMKYLLRFHKVGNGLG